MRFHGIVGYGVSQEIRPGVWIDEITERSYFGDVTPVSVRWDNSGGVNDDLNVRNTISIIADAFAYNHFSFIKYVEWMGVKWKVTQVEVQRPRLILTLGGEWNGESN